jgi:hypothetical protein
LAIRIDDAPVTVYFPLKQQSWLDDKSAPFGWELLTAKRSGSFDGNSGIKDRSR